jgi:hypothetical protein
VSIRTPSVAAARRSRCFGADSGQRHPGRIRVGTPLAVRANTFRRPRHLVCSADPSRPSDRGPRGAQLNWRRWRKVGSHTPSGARLPAASWDVPTARSETFPRCVHRRRRTPRALRPLSVSSPERRRHRRHTRGCRRRWMLRRGYARQRFLSRLTRRRFGGWGCGRGILGPPSECDRWNHDRSRRSRGSQPPGCPAH